MSIARRHLYSVAVLGTAALLARSLPAKAHHHHDDDDDHHCFLRGTLITTPDGDRLVEQLHLGDLILTQAGPRPIEIIHRYTPHVAPVLIKRAALGPDQPNRDLYLSQMHGVLIDGDLVTAASLVNDRSIQYADDVDNPEYFHIELADHGIMYAAGVPCETCTDNEYTLAIHDVGRRSRIKSHLRSVFMPAQRQKIDLIRERLVCE